MNLQEKIKEDLKDAMVKNDKEVKSILRVLIGELNREGKIIPNDRVVAIVKKMIENAKELGNHDEANILEVYIPKQLTEDQISGIVTALVFQNNYTIKDMGKIMNHIKADYAGRYDGKVVNTIVKDILSQQ